jgi:hypothetical protein
MFNDDILLLTPLTGVSSVMYTFYVEKGITIIPRFLLTEIWISLWQSGPNAIDSYIV